MFNQKIEKCKIDTPNVHCFVLEQALKENRKEISVFYNWRTKLLCNILKIAPQHWMYTHRCYCSLMLCFV
jgi:hypothetical protein